MGGPGGKRGLCSGHRFLRNAFEFFDFINDVSQPGALGELFYARHRTLLQNVRRPSNALFFGECSRQVGAGHNLIVEELGEQLINLSSRKSSGAELYFQAAALDMT